MKAVSSSPSLPSSSLLPSSLPLSSLHIELKSNFESEAFKQKFLIQKLVETVTPQKGFPFPEIARDLGAPDFTILEQELSSSVPPLIAEIDRNSSIEIQSDHLKYQNITHEMRRDNYETKETSISDLVEIPELSSMIGSTGISGNESDGIIEMSKHVENEEDTLPPEVRAIDPFATAVTEEFTVSTSSTSQENILYMIQKINSLTTTDLNNSDNTPSEKVNVDQAGALHGSLDAIDRISTIITSSLKPEQEMITTGTTNTTEMTLEIQEMLQETKVIMSEEQNATAAFGTKILETMPGIFLTTAADVVTPMKETAEMPVFHPVVSRTFNADSDDENEATTINRSEIITDGTTAVDILWKPEKYHISLGTMTGSESATTSVEIEHKSEQPKISTISVELPSTTNEFNTDKNRENEKEQDDEHVHDDESVFVGDKTLFNQNGIMKQDFSVMHSMSEENFGVPGFSRAEVLGPEATEEIHQTETDATTRQSFNTEFKMRAAIPIDLVKHSREYHNGEHIPIKESQTTAKSLKENGEPKDISVIDDSFYVHTDTEEAASMSKPTTDKRKLEPEAITESETTPKPLPFSESGLLKSSKANPEPMTGFEPKVEQEITSKFGDSKRNNGDFNDVSFLLTFSGFVKEGAYKVPFSFRITSIDYIPEFADPGSGKYKKLRDQLLPDLEEIFGSVFGHIYEGIRLVSFLKGSVTVDGIVYTSAKTDDMEQSATEFEQQITAKNLQIGGNDVDPRSILLDGYISKNYVERIHEGYTSNNPSSYIVGGGIAVGILAVLLIAFIIITMNNKRTNGTLKLKEENIAMAQSSRSIWPNGTSTINLMAYGNDRAMTHRGTTNNTQPPMVMIGSQMHAVHTHATDHAIQPHV